jgi:hypothetical protein
VFLSVSKVNKNDLKKAFKNSEGRLKDRFWTAAVDNEHHFIQVMKLNG